MLQRKHFFAACAVIVGCIIGVALPVEAQRGGGGVPGTLISTTYKGLTTTRSYQPMPTTSLGADGKVVTTTYPAVHAQPIGDELRRSYRLDPFYTKTLSIRGVQVIGSDKVSDWAFLEAAYTLDHQFWHSPQWVRDGFAQTKVRLAIISDVEYTMDMPENRNMGQGAYNDRRSRGLGGFPWCSCAEENLLNLRGDPYGGNNPQRGGENITIHEFSHTTASMIRSLQRQGIGVSTTAAADAAPVTAVAGGAGGGRGRGGRGDAPGSWGAKMDAAFAKANAPGGRCFLWNQQRGGQVYASTSWQEYWAEGAQAWFDNANPSNSGGLSVRDDVKQKDPDLAALLLEIYGDEKWRYVKTTATITNPDGTIGPARPADEFAHLVGLDALRPQFPVFNFNNSPRIIAAASQPGGAAAIVGAGPGQGGGRGRGRGNVATTSGPATTTVPATAVGGGQ